MPVWLFVLGLSLWTALQLIALQPRAPCCATALSPPPWTPSVLRVDVDGARPAACGTATGIASWRRGGHWWQRFEDKFLNCSASVQHNSGTDLSACPRFA